MARTLYSRLFNLAIQVMQKSREKENVESGCLVKHDYSVPYEHAINYCATRSVSKRTLHQPKQLGGNTLLCDAKERERERERERRKTKG